MMVATHLIPQAAFALVRDCPTLGEFDRLALIADMCRFNTLNAVKRAGSGHLGSSFSAMDLMVLLYYRYLNVGRVGVASPERDVFLSSKGHDVPAQYSVLFSLGIVPREKLLRLRRLDGLEGHPNVQVPGIEANTGSLGMGISKGRGIAVAKRLRGLGGAVYVMTGDGELQEGQIHEALQTTAHQRVGLTVIVDHNKVQSDRPVAEITDLGDLAAKVRASGWEVSRCNGHDLPSLAQVLDHFATLRDRPRLLIADTVKGRGVSFMEHPRALRDGQGVYRWHAGAPDDEPFARAHQELLSRVEAQFAAHGLGAVALDSAPVEAKAGGAATSEFVVEAFGRRLVDLGGRHPELVVLDGDLAADCRIRYFEDTFPERFVENGIAEQDMVSMAGAMARHGLLPVVNSFAAFLAARANEQIYNNVTEGSKVIYVCHFGGVVPAGPGPSHQSVRDISLFGALPGVTIVEPCNGPETAMLLDWCVEQAPGACMLRLAIGPCPRTVILPADYRPVPGRGIVLREGNDLMAFGYGPVMLHELLTAAEALVVHGLSVAVVNMPWLNAVDGDWLRETVDRFPLLVTVEDHAPVGGLGDSILRALARGDLLRDRRHWTIGCEDVPACGTPGETLHRHGLDAASLSRRLVEIARTRGFAGVLGDAPAGAAATGADAPIG